MKILAEPTLVCLSGQAASFLAGGEFPIPVPQALGTVAIKYKPFGVGLRFTPTVLTNVNQPAGVARGVGARLPECCPVTGW